MEANANKFTFVWGKSIKTSKARIGKQLDQLWSYTQKVAEEELKEEPTPDFEHIDTKKVTETIEKIRQGLGRQKSR